MASLTGHVCACVVHIEGFNGTLETITVAPVWTLCSSLFLHIYVEIPAEVLEELEIRPSTSRMNLVVAKSEWVLLT